MSTTYYNRMFVGCIFPWSLHRVVTVKLLLLRCCCTYFVCFAVDSRRRRCHFHHHRRHFTLLDNEKQTAETSLLHKAQNFCTPPLFSGIHCTDCGAMCLVQAHIRSKILREITLYNLHGGEQAAELRKFSKNILLLLLMLLCFAFIDEYYMCRNETPVPGAPTSQNTDSKM